MAVVDGVPCHLWLYACPLTMYVSRVEVKADWKQKHKGKGKHVHRINNYHNV